LAKHRVPILLFSDKISAFPRKLASHNSVGKKGDKEVNKTKAREKRRAAKKDQGKFAINFLAN